MDARETGAGSASETFHFVNSLAVPCKKCCLALISNYGHFTDSFNFEFF